VLAISVERSAHFKFISRVNADDSGRAFPNVSNQRRGSSELVKEGEVQVDRPDEFNTA
jgi:hypothetical protein